MLEQFFECPESREAFEDYDIRQMWAAEQLTGCKFVYAVAEEVNVSRLFPQLFSLFLRARKCKAV